ncbi:MAG: hypothetical protein ACRD4P_17430, partial [Bryobacteraceae bacterium]
NSDYKLKPGMTANVSIIIAQRENALEIPNGALRFRPPETAVPQTNAAPSATATNQAGQNAGGATQSRGFGGQGRRAGGFGGFGGRNGGPGRGRSERPAFHTVYILAPDSTDKNPKLQPVQIRTGISDGINTEVLDGLKEGDHVVTGMISSETMAPQTSNPFGGGFPGGRRR